MPRLFNHSGMSKKDISAEELRQLLDLPSGSDDDNLSGFSSCSDEDPTVNPKELFDYTSSDNDSSSEDRTESVDLSHSSPSTSQRVDNKYVSHVIAPLNDHNYDKSIDFSQKQSQMNGTPKSIKTTTKRIHCTWKKKNLSLTEEQKKFRGNLDYSEEIKGLETPYQFFKYFFKDELFEKIKDECMLYISQKDPTKVFQITTSDMEKFVGICLLTSVSNSSNVRDFWNDIIGNDLVKKTMSLNTFEKIRSNLHFNDNSKQIPKGEPGYDKLYKIRPVIEYLQKSFSSVRMDESLSLDEQMCATKVRHHLRQYIQNKPHKWGYKLFVLCSTTGFAYRFEIYTGQENDPTFRLPTEPDLGASSNVVVRLARYIPKHANHKIYFDNYYTSVPLMVYLHKQGILSLGTVRRNRIPDCKLPTEKELSKLPRGTSEEFVASVDGVDISSVIWKDNKCVTLLSTFTGKLPEIKVRRYERSSKTHKEVDCPEIVTVYNKHMGGVDLMDSHLGRHSTRVKSKKWYFRLFYHLLDLAIINAWILYKEVLLMKRRSEKPLNQKHFRLEVVQCLCRLGRSGSKRGRPSNDIQNQLEARKKCSRAIIPPQDVRSDSIAHWPMWNAKRNRCKYPGCTGYTFVTCSKCNAYLCFNKDKNCFTNFHQ